MRRFGTLGFVLFALAASLPAEIRECLPRAKDCPRVVAASPRCALAAKSPHCSRVARPAKVPCTPQSGSPSPLDCRLHPTPDGTTTREPLPLPAPVLVRAADAALPQIEAPLPDPSRAGWIEPPHVRPRAAPRAAPFSPRPPPLAA
jgi:hypothetical protein